VHGTLPDHVLKRYSYHWSLPKPIFYNVHWRGTHISLIYLCLKFTETTKIKEALFKIHIKELLLYVSAYYTRKCFYMIRVDQHLFFHLMRDSSSTKLNQTIMIPYDRQKHMFSLGKPRQYITKTNIQFHD